MTPNELKDLTRQIVADARRLSAAHTSEHNAPVNYACVFAQSEREYSDLSDAARQLGLVVHETPTGPVFKIAPLDTEAGMLHLLKIRRPDPNRKERGDADFTVRDFPTFKKAHLGRSGFSLIQRPQMEMVELIDPSFHVLAYYSFPTLAEVLNVNTESNSQPSKP